MSRQDAADALAYGFCAHDDIMAARTVDNFLDWDRLKDNGACSITDEALADLGSRAGSIFSKRIDSLPYNVMIWRHDYSMTTKIQRVHYASDWTGRKPRKHVYSHCKGCGHIGQYLAVPAFCPHCRTPNPEIWPPRIIIRLIDLLSSLIVLKK